MTVLAIVWNIDAVEQFAFLPEQFYAVVLGLALAVVFLTVRIDRTMGGPLPWYDALLALISLVVLFYVGVDFLRLKDVEYAGSTTTAITIGAIIALLLLEGLRRSGGYVILTVVLVFLLYAPLGHLIPGPLIGAKIELWKLAANLGFNPNAIFGIPLQVGSSIVIMFILFGQVLFKAGGGEFFTDIASATMGRRRGGAAKISVVGSGLFGTISGTAVSNVVTTGIITIPLMRRAGYKNVDAGAIEAIASTGGQFMPPIMGAAAFVMAEWIEVPYAEIVMAAIIPAVLYYFAVFIQVDLIAARDKISVVQEDIPKVWDVLKEGWHFLIPFVLLIVLLFRFNMPPEKAAIYSSLFILLAGFVKSYKGHRLKLGDIYRMIADTGRIVIELLMIVASAGIVIGVLNLTGLGFALTLLLVDLGGGYLWAVLLIAAVACIILGMGMPTVAVYILLAALVAPGIEEAGVALIPTHMFILYFGMMSMITPPIALAAFAAATITKANPMSTGFAAMRMGWVAYVIPFLFVASPSLLGVGPLEFVVLNGITAAFGVFLISVASIGYFTRPLSAAMRLLFLAAGTASLIPDTYLGLNHLVDGAGIVLGVLLMTREYMAVRGPKREAA